MGEPDLMQQILAYCRIDDPSPEELALLESMETSAEGYLALAGVARPAAGTPRRAQWNLAVCALVLDAWDRRGATGSAGAVSEEPGFRRLLTQLKLTEPEVAAHG